MLITRKLSFQPHKVLHRMAPSLFFFSSTIDNGTFYPDHVTICPGTPSLHDLGQESEYLKPYLQKLKENQQQYKKIRNGYFSRQVKRYLLCLPTRTELQTLWITYIVHTGNIDNYLSDEALLALGYHPPHEKFQLFINNRETTVKRSHNNYNFLGMDFMKTNGSLAIHQTQLQYRFNDLYQ